MKHRNHIITRYFEILNFDFTFIVILWVFLWSGRNILHLSQLIEIVYNSLWLFCYLASTSCGYYYSSSAFLFSLVNKAGWGAKKLLQTGKYSSKRYSIYSCSSIGLRFGGGYDIYIVNPTSSNTISKSNLGYTFQLPNRRNSYGSSFDKSFLAGSYQFRPDEIEVFYETNWTERSEGTMICKTLIYLQSRQTSICGYRPQISLGNSTILSKSLEREHKLIKVTLFRTRE